MNIGILAHVDAGKTSITELLLYKSGTIRSLGNVDKGTSQTDWLDIEIERGISIRLATASFEYDDKHINIIDTPGHIDFSSEVERSLLALDCAVLVISAAEGVQAHTNIIWEALRELNIPTLLFVNKTDRAGTNIELLIDEIKKELSSDILVLQEVSNEGTDSVTIRDTDLFNREIKELIIEKDESLLELFLENNDIKDGDILNSLQNQISVSSIFPVLFGSAKFDLGIDELISCLSTLFPTAESDIDAPPEGIIYKVEHHPTIGKIASVRLFKGSLKTRDNIKIQGVEELNKISQIRKLQGQKYEDIGILNAGDSAALCGLKDARAGSFIGETNNRNYGFSLNTPLLTIKVSLENSQDYSALVKSFQQLSDEDPSLQLVWLKEERELHIKVMGLVQIEILKSTLISRFGISAVFDEPTIIYKETPSRSGIAYEEYTMPKPCWAVVLFNIEAAKAGSGVEYHSIVGVNKIESRYQKEIERTIPKALQQGIKGWEVTDLKITLVDGEHHNIHSRAGDFAVATPMAIMKGLKEIGTDLLEPIMNFSIKAPEEYLGKIASELTKSEAEIQTHLLEDEIVTIKGLIPLTTSLEFPVTLASISSGKAKYRTRLAMYRKCNRDVITDFRGINPLNRAKYILQARKALNA